MTTSIRNPDLALWGDALSEPALRADFTCSLLGENLASASAAGGHPRSHVASANGALIQSSYFGPESNVSAK
jgi:hypothetical protein